MNFKKTILYLIFSIFILILMYNFVLPFLSTQYTFGMGMHMGYSYQSFYYQNIFGLLIFLFIIFAVIIIVFQMLSKQGPKRCKNCGLIIENDEWKICPRCGTALKDGSVK